MRSKVILFLLTILTLGTAFNTARAQDLSFHLDVAVRAENGQLTAAFCGDPALGCDSLPVLEQLGLDPTQVPRDAVTGSPIFISDFGDLAGGAYSTDDPGFQALAGWLPSDLLLSYQALGNLSYWDPAAKTWSSQVPGDARVRLFGGLPADGISTDPTVCGGLPFCLIGEEASTVFTAHGIEAAPSLIIDNTSPTGALHAHLDWFLESPTGARGGPRGAYLLSMRITGAGLAPSNTFMVMLNSGLSVSEYAEAIQARMSHTVSATAGTGGSISPGSTNVRHGQTASFTLSPLAGYSIETVTGCGGTRSGNTFVTGPINTACAVSATFSRNRYTVAASAGTGGSISPASIAIEHGATATFTVVADASHTIASVVGCNGLLNGSTYVTAPITGACAVVAAFTSNNGGTQHTITALAGSGGRIEPSSLVVAEGATATFMVASDEGFAIASVSGCGGSLNGNVFTTATVNASCAVNAVFSVNEYSVTAAAGSGGAVSPTSVVVTHGGTAAFNVVPEAGYSVSSVAGCTGTLRGNTFTTAQITAPCHLAFSFGSAKPIFEPSTPPRIELDATGVLTELPSDRVPRAVDREGRPVSVMLSGGATRFLAGTHVLTWRAVDNTGAVATVEQELKVHPRVSMGPDVRIGFRQDNSGSFRIVLSGPAPDYPFSIGYEVRADVSGHDLESGSVQLNQGETSKEVHFAITQNPAPGTPDQQLTVQLAEGINAGARRSLAISLRSANSAPVVTIRGQQNGMSSPTFARNGGQIELTAEVHDPDSADTHTVQWQSPAGATVTSNGVRLFVDPSTLGAGIHAFEAVVTDSGSPPLVARGNTYVVITESAVSAPAGAAGWGENGLPAHPDYSPAVDYVLPQRTRELKQFLIEADPGSQLALGPYAALAGGLRAGVTAASMPATDAVKNVGGYFDFIVRNLSAAGAVANIVVPQHAPIPANAQYRKLSPITRTWQNFVTTANDALASTRGAEGYCPPPQSPLWGPGLTAGDWCVRLTLSDGGPNDGDGQANGSIVDPGGVGAEETVIVKERPPNGGAGSVDTMLLIVVGFLMLIPRHRRMRRW